MEDDASVGIMTKDAEGDATDDFKDEKSPKKEKKSKKSKDRSVKEKDKGGGDDISKLVPPDNSIGTSSSAINNNNEVINDAEKERNNNSESKKKKRDSKDKDSGKERGKTEHRSSRHSQSRSPDRRERRERERERVRDRERDRERDRDRGRRRSPTPPRRRHENRSRSPVGRRDNYRDRDRERRRRSRSRSRSSDRDRDRRNRRRSRSRSRSKSNDRDRAGKKNDTADSSNNNIRPLTLTDIFKTFPGISMPEAVQRLNAHNTAVAMMSSQIIPSALSVPKPQGLPPQLSLPMTLPFFQGGIGLPSQGIPMPPLSLHHSSMQLASGNGNAPSAALSAVAALSGVIGVGGALTKPFRELYIGNIPPGVNVASITNFLNSALNKLGLSKDNMQSVVSAWVSGDGHYCFVEMRTIEETNGSLFYLDKLQIGNFQIKVGRPKTYAGGAPETSVPAIPGGLTVASALSSLSLASMPVVSTPSMPGLGIVLPNFPLPIEQHSVIMVTNLPNKMTDDEVRELVSTFGALKAFNVIKTGGTTQSAVFEYQDTSVTETALATIPKVEFAGNKLSVQRVPAHTASILLQPTTIPAPPKLPPPPRPVEVRDQLADLPPTTVLRLLNMVMMEDLKDDELYMELQEDVSEECNSHGSIKLIVIPRGGESDNIGVGQIFVQFTSPEGAIKARAAVSGRSFNGQTVKATFYPEDLFKNKILSLPDGYNLLGRDGNDQHGDDGNFDNNKNSEGNAIAITDDDI